MTVFLQTRRRQIQAKGRPVVLRRAGTFDASTMQPPANIDVTVQCRTPRQLFRAEQSVQGLVQGDEEAWILNDEIAAAGWPGPPKAGDTMIIDGANWSVVGNRAVYAGPLLIGHNITIRGGAA